MNIASVQSEKCTGIERKIAPHGSSENNHDASTPQNFNGKLHVNISCGIIKQVNIEQPWTSFSLIHSITIDYILMVH